MNKSNPSSGQPVSKLFNSEMEDFIAHAREAGQSWRKISMNLKDAGIEYSHEALRTREKKSKSATDSSESAPITAEKIVRAIRSLVQERIDAGISWKELAPELKDAGVDIAIPTFRVYMSNTKPTGSGSVK